MPLAGMSRAARGGGPLGTHHQALERTVGTRLPGGHTGANCLTSAPVNRLAF